MSKRLPEKFLILTHEGLAKAQITVEPLQNMDAILTKFGGEKLHVLRNVADSPFGRLHVASWVGENTRSVYTLELTQGVMAMSTNYHTVTVKGQSWVSPCFGEKDEAFPLRCAFDFGVWAKAGLRLFLGLLPSNSQVAFWVFYQGQVYRPPIGNLFEGTCVVCLGQNQQHTQGIFKMPGQSYLAALHKAVQMLSESPWNRDTYIGSEAGFTSGLIRYDATLAELPMLPPLDAGLIAKCSVCTNRDLAQITSLITL